MSRPFAQKRRAAALVACGLLLLAGCGSMTKIRIENASPLDFSDVSIAGQAYGDLAAGASTDYRDVPLKFRYAVVRFTASGHDVTAQTLNLGARRFTYRIRSVDPVKGHVTLDVVREKPPKTSDRVGDD